ncbi:MAG: hypothetical protein LBM61_05595, partial [Prevotellaceae bacterium]|nr:hypothetical protein [Prevotellaceae bacterium]
MANKDSYIMKRSFDFVRELLAEIESHQIANDLLYQYFGIRSFFLDDAELNQIKIFINKPDESIERTDRAEYGDFQTNAHLALHVTNLIAEKGISPNVVIEPTCGVGNFMVASLATFKGIKVLFGIDIYKPYTWECKFNIIDYYLDNSPTDKPDIYIMHANVFEYDFNSIRKKYHHDNILIVGNPPWVTNSMLGSLNSSNIPRKSNFKNQNGIDAITGKGN